MRFTEDGVDRLLIDPSKATLHSEVMLSIVFRVNDAVLRAQW